MAKKFVSRLLFPDFYAPPSWLPLPVSKLIPSPLMPTPLAKAISANFTVHLLVLDALPILSPSS